MYATLPQEAQALEFRAPYRTLRTRERALDVERRPGGSLVLSCPYPVGTVRRDILDYLLEQAARHPDRPMLAERGPDGQWRRISYGEMRSATRSIAQGLLNHGLRSGDCLAILSANSIQHAAMMLGAMLVGVIAVPVTPAYSLLDRSHAKLRHIARLTTPAAIYADDARNFSEAISAVCAEAGRTPVIITGSARPGTSDLTFEQLSATPATEAVDRAYEGIGPDTIAKILFTSGSTGLPKGVINTHGMMCHSQAMSTALQTEDDQAEPTLSGLPWSHTMGGNVLFNRNMRIGGTFYLDDGRPVGAEFARTVANLKEILPPTIINVPIALQMLADALEADEDFNRAFFERLDSMAYGAAALSDELWNRIQRLAVKATGQRIPFVTGYGCTETAPAVCSLYWLVEGAGIIGLPVPGVQLKLVPMNDGRWDLRVRGPNVMPGYYRQPELTAAAFDDEGFYCLGDAARFVDDADPLQGLRFAGRTKEDFKLLTGTWVAAGPLREALKDALAPYAQDLLTAGQDRESICILIWPNLKACRELMQAPAATLSEAAQSPVVRDAVARALAAYNATHGTGASTRVARAVLLDAAPSVEEGEINEKGYVVQSVALGRRQALVEQLYAKDVPPWAIVP
jgi:feruloyl-CoA synthase